MQQSSSYTPEFQSVLNFLQEHPDTSTWCSNIPQAQSQDAIKSMTTAQALTSLSGCLTGDGTPVCITDALTNCQAIKKWSFEYLQENHGHCHIRANNRAPARHADNLPGNGGAQHTIESKLQQYITQHILSGAPESLEDYSIVNTSPPKSTPFYLNGWRAFIDVESFAEDCPMPAPFTAEIDHTLELLHAVDKQLFGPTNSSQSSWCSTVNKNLNKLFIGPPGVTTRLHFDAGDANGWLGQIRGRKLFILYPPDQHTKDYLYPLESEIETEQSPIDPLFPDIERYPLYAQLKPLCCILHPGQALIIPRGWWHYAVALDRTITVQRNFYNATTNAAGLVQMVLKTINSMKQK